MSMDAKTETAISDSDAFAASWDEPQKSALSQAELDKLKTGCTVDGIHYGPMEATIDTRGN